LIDVSKALARSGKKMTTARFSMGTTETNGAQVVMIHAETKRDAQAAIKLAKSWIWSNGLRLKLVYFHENIGTRWSNIGRSYAARIVFKA
jgi:hypothetical protein